MTKVSKKVKTKAPARPNKKSRELARPEYKTLRLSKRIKHPDGKLANFRTVLARSWLPFKKHPKQFLVLTLVYFLLTILLVKGLTATAGLSELRTTLTEAFGAEITTATMLSTLFSTMVSSAGSVSGEVGSFYQSMLLVLFSLVFIWSIRISHAGRPLSVKSAFYGSTYPLFQFLGVMAVGMLQLIPAVIGAFLAGVVYAGGIAVSPIEQTLWAVLIFLFFLWSFYMLVSTVIALYVVTLPDMQPLQSLRTAKNLVGLRRWSVLQKIVLLVLFVLVVLLVILLPILLFATPLAEWVYALLAAALLPFIHSYLYALYRELI